MTICCFVTTLIHDSPSEIEILVKKKHLRDNTVDIRTSCTGLVLETAAANSAIWSLTWLFLVTEWRSVNSQPCHSIYKRRSLSSAPLDLCVTLAQCVHCSILGGE